MKIPDLRKLPAAAKAQAWGLAVSFALGLLATERLDYSLAAFVLGFLLTWVIWELTYGLKLGAKLGNDTRSISIALALGLLIPWGGFFFAYVLNAMRA